MYSTFLIIFVLVFSNQLFCSHGIDDKQEKSKKSSSVKRKLSDAENLKVADSDSIEVESSNADPEPISVLGITVPPEFVNDTVLKDHHIYYNSTFYSAPEVAQKFWVDLDAEGSKAKIHEMLSNSHRQATNIQLSFEFPFYGHLMKNITIATGGFLYMGDYLHNWIAATQYIAPLMANFDTSQSVNSTIKYADNGTAFTTQWENVFLQDHVNDGGFTFQATLHMNGDIVFAYKAIPYAVANISDTRHPVKVGISDAYILERTLFFLKRKTIYEYHRIDLLNRNIANSTAFHIVALPTCPLYKNCSSCLAANPKLECKWCPALNRCSDGIDRARQAWVSNGCVVNKQATCAAEPISSSTTDPSGAKIVTVPSGETSSKVEEGKYSTSGYGSTAEYNTYTTYNDIHGSAHFIQESSTTMSGISTGAVITIVVFILALIMVVVWIGYAYKFPQTSSGQFLIKYRPSQWTLRPKDGSSGTSNSRHF